MLPITKSADIKYFLNIIIIYKKKNLYIIKWQVKV